MRISGHLRIFFFAPPARTKRPNNSSNSDSDNDRDDNKCRLDRQLRRSRDDSAATPETVTFALEARSTRASRADQPFLQ